MRKKIMMCVVLFLTATLTVSAQIIKPEDLEKYAKERYGDSWLTAAANLSKHITFVEKDNKKRTCAKALVMTYAYSNVVLDKIEDTVKNGLVGNENDDW